MREPERKASAIPAIDTPSLDLIFELLSNRRRRYALYHLRELADGVATIDELTERVARLEQRHDRSVEDRSSIATSLQHVHLPKLEDAGILEYDSRSETVRYWGQPSLDEWLEHAQHKEL